MKHEDRAVVPFKSLFAIPTRNGIHKGPDYQGSGTAVIKMGEVYKANHVTNASRDRLELTGSEAERFAVAPGDLLFCRTSLVPEGVGRCAIADSLNEVSVFASNLIRCRLDTSVADPRYWLYYFSSPAGLRHMRSIARGTSVTTITGPDIGSLEVPSLSLATQRRIAWILGALDDKIELNRKLAQVLEATAAAIFKARFVDFEGVEEFENSEMGSIPKGWRVAELGDICESIRDKEQVADSTHDAPYFGLDRMPEGSTVLWEWDQRSKVKGETRKFLEGDILFGKLRPYFKKVGPAPLSGSCSTEILVIRPHAGMFALALGHFSSDRFIEFCMSVARGTRMPRAEWADTKHFRIVVPPEDLVAGLSEAIEEIRSKIASLVYENHSLASIRDGLLPRLISGEIRVPEGVGPDLEPEEIVRLAEV